ncbi:BA14K family protein [Sphingobium sp. WTD-1]|uniref:BA14K family protein n=1 Tax=Sphingobium sp. WTD-1 TaxID=2979467 RepID=UPI0024DE7EE1|nr:BA14K family protein [Sphingobium sp. WTD-1]WIA58431.1 BA14K family protein [Sphingobium sp. WTD-1]
MTYPSLLTLGAAALMATLGAPAMAQAPHHGASQPVSSKAPAKKPAPVKAQPAKAQPAKAQGRSTGAAHQKACRNRYKSYDAKLDSYLYRGKRVRCTL